MTKPINETHGEKPSRRSASVDLLGSNSEIARKLKQYHDELLSLEVPERFGDLLSKLEHAEKAGASIVSETTVGASEGKAED
jgi:hypothetical protein